MQISLLLESAGANVVIADNIRDALDWADLRVWSAAIVNQAYCGEDLSLICERLKAGGIPVISCGGHGQSRGVLTLGAPLSDPMRKVLHQAVDLMLAS